MGQPPRIEASGLSKTFGRTQVLSGAHLRIEPGEIHALVGQNGSGKSTLVKLLTGYHAPDAGASVAVDGQPIALPVRWAEASAVGVSVVHQDLGLIDRLTVSENIGIGGFVQSRITRKIDWKAQDAVAQRVLDRLDVPISPKTPVAGLSAMRRAEVAIARALRQHKPGRGLVILDEATRSLPREELDRFHRLLKRVVADGTSILMVSHNLDEVLKLADKVTVLRDGAVAASGLSTAGLTESDVARHMLGRTVDVMHRDERDIDTTEVLLHVEGLAAPGVNDLSFTIRRGEVVGLTGLPGTGFELVPKLISGATVPQAGHLTTPRGTLDLTRADVPSCMRAGIALVPEKRIFEGLALELSIRDNMAVPNLRRRGRPWFVGRSWQEAAAKDAIRRLSIQTRSPKTLTKELSGGNQQKVLLAKWLSVRPDVVVLHEPTQAVDVGARVDILRTVRETAATGMGVLFTSIEPSDLVETCDRILVVGRDGSLSELRTREADEVLHAIYGEPITTQGQP
jgi:ribose transport system ATP-binding protein